MILTCCWWSCVSVAGSMFLSVFFFFKQKTAYEMLISDWSSDVCSSDLWFIDNLPVPSKPRQYEFARLNLTHTVLSKRVLTTLVREGKIGRASCRERVCQYV